MKGVVLVVGDVEVNGTDLLKMAEERGMRIEFIERVQNRLNDISERLYSLSSMDYEVIFTIGGTGIEDEDVVPEATEMVIDKKIPGLEYFILREIVDTAFEGMFARVVAGLRKDTLIINLPSTGYERVFPKIVDAIVGVKRRGL